MFRDELEQIIDDQIRSGNAPGALVLEQLSDALRLPFVSSAQLPTSPPLSTGNSPYFLLILRICKQVCTPQLTSSCTVYSMFSGRRLAGGRAHQRHAWAVGDGYRVATGPHRAHPALQTRVGRAHPRPARLRDRHPGAAHSAPTPLPSSAPAASARSRCLLDASSLLQLRRATGSTFRRGRERS